MGRRGSALGVAAVVALVPVVASAAMVVPSIATASSSAGTDVSGVAAALAGQVDADPSEMGDVAGNDPSDVVAKGSNSTTASCPTPPAGAAAVAPAEPCAASEPPPAADATAVAGAALSVGAAAFPVSVGGGLVFDAGNIVSDAVFYNDAAMTDEQIAAFLSTQGAGCAGQWCLKNLRVDVAAQPADEFCASVPAGIGLSAAAVIGAVSRACGVNPQVMLTTLEKESGLLDRSSVSASNYDAAYGWHCPDTGPGGSANCDPAYAGFVNQAYGMAKQWSRYRVHPEQYRYRAGETVNILWNVVESGCGGAPVTIANTATAALYNYTPYQPNPAALAAYPGVGDACSAYGNRNFFFLFNRYFGSTGGGNTGIAVGTGAVATAAVLTAPVAVPVPANGFVAGGLAGRSIMAPTAAVAAGLTAGFAALGLPYVWGGGGSGAGPNNGCARGGGQYNSCGTDIGFDCSGLTAYVLGQAGFTIPGDSSSQRRSGIPVAWDRALPGDIVGYPGHVAVYLGVTDGIRYILEASWVGTPVHIVPLTRSDADPTVYRYWTSTPGLAVAAGSGVSAARTFVPNLPPLPGPARSTTADPAQPATPTVAAPQTVTSQAPLTSASSSSSASSGSPSSSAPSSAQSSGSAPQTTGSTPTGTTSTTATTTSATGTTGTGTTVTGTTGSGTATTTQSTAVTGKSTTATGTGPAATSAPTTAQPATTSSLPTTTTSTATSAATTAPSTATAPPPTTPVICPPATAVTTATVALTPTLPPPSITSPATAAGTAKAPAVLTPSSTFAALLESLTADPCG